MILKKFYVFCLLCASAATYGANNYIFLDTVRNNSDSSYIAWTTNAPLCGQTVAKSENDRSCIMGAIMAGTLKLSDIFSSLPTPSSFSIGTTSYKINLVLDPSTKNAFTLPKNVSIQQMTKPELALSIDPTDASQNQTIILTPYIDVFFHLCRQPIILIGRAKDNTLCVVTYLRGQSDMDEGEGCVLQDTRIAGPLPTNKWDDPNRFAPKKINPNVRYEFGRIEISINKIPGFYSPTDPTAFSIYTVLRSLKNISEGTLIGTPEYIKTYPQIEKDALFGYWTGNQEQNKTTHPGYASEIKSFPGAYVPPTQPQPPYDDTPLKNYY